MLGPMLPSLLPEGPVNLIPATASLLGSSGKSPMLASSVTLAHLQGNYHTAGRTTFTHIVTAWWPPAPRPPVLFAQ